MEEIEDVIGLLRKEKKLEEASKKKSLARPAWDNHIQPSRPILVTPQTSPVTLDRQKPSSSPKVDEMFSRPAFFQRSLPSESPSLINTAASAQAPAAPLKGRSFLDSSDDSQENSDDSQENSDSPPPKVVPFAPAVVGSSEHARRLMLNMKPNIGFHIYFLYQFCNHHAAIYHCSLIFNSKHS